MNLHNRIKTNNFRSGIYVLLLSSVLVLTYILGIVPGFVQTVNADIPKLINFQGKLTKVSDGTNVADGDYAFEFKLYDAASSGNLLWTETYDQVNGDCAELNVVNGVFNTKLGSCNSLAGIDFTGGSIYLTINFDPGTGYDGEMSPRKQLVASAYSFVANSLNGDGTIDLENTSATQASIGYDGTNKLTVGIANTGFTTLTVAGSAPGFNFAGGSVGVGTSGPDRKLDILDASNPQMRLTYTDGSVYTDLQTTSAGELYIAPSGSNVGIGTSNPSYPLDVQGSSTAGRFYGGSGGNPTLIVDDNGNNGGIAIRASGTQYGRLASQGALFLDADRASTDLYLRATADVILRAGGLTSSNLVVLQDTGVIQMFPRVTTGTGSNSGVSITADSLTTGAGLNVSSSSLTSGSLVNLSSTSIAAASNTQKVLNVTTSGANASSTQTTYGGYFTNTHTGTSSTNVAAYFSASGGTNNYAAIFESGYVGVGTTAPGATLPNTFVNHADSRLIQVSSASSSGDAGIFLRRSDNAVGLDLWADSSSGSSYIDSRHNSNIHFRLNTNSSPNPIMSIAYAGGANGVGIGTTTPTAKLEVVNDNASQPVLKATAAPSQSSQIAVIYASDGSTKALELTTSGLYVRGISSGGELTISTNASGRGARFTHSASAFTFVGSMKWAPASVVPQITANQDNWNYGNYRGMIQRWTSDAARDVTGIFWSSSTPAEGYEMFYAYNAGSFDITLKHEDASSTAGYRFNNATGTDIVLEPGDMAQFIYDGTISRWNVWHIPGTPGSGGSIPSFTQGSIVFQGGSGLDEDNASFFWDDTNDRLGLGANASLKSKLHVVGSVTTSGADAIAGIYEDLTLTNSTASGFQFGDRSIITIDGGTAGTHVGQFIRMIDDTSLSSGQVVRGLEVQAYSGTNNNGINTGIATYGKTFGIQAETSAQAGGVSQPAAVFAYLNQASGQENVGNAIRAYSNTIQGADLVNLYHETSTSFSGNGIVMNFGNNSGTFTGNFISLQKAGVESFHVDDDGSTFVSLTGTQTTVALCHATNGQTNNDEIVDCSGAPSDVAEYFGSRDASLAAGEVVVSAEAAQDLILDGYHTSKAWIERSNKGYQNNILGVISTAPAQVYGDEIFDASENPRPVALVGRVPVKVTNENGAIKPGDFLTSSATQPGYAMRATRSGVVIGQALSGYDGTGTAEVIVFVNVGFQSIGNKIVLEAPSVEGEVLQSGDEDSQALTNPASTFVIQQQAEPDSDDVVADILQLQSGDQNRFMVANSGATAILTSLICDEADECPSVLKVTQANTELVNIDARGNLAIAGTIFIKEDSFAGSVATNADGLAEITFAYHLGTGKPVVQLTAEAQLPIFAQVVEFKQDDEGNYTGFVIKTFDLISSPISSVVHYTVIGKSAGYITYGEVAPIPLELDYSDNTDYFGNDSGLIIQNGEVAGEEEGGAGLEQDNHNEDEANQESLVSESEPVAASEPLQIIESAS